MVIVWKTNGERCNLVTIEICLSSWKVLCLVGLVSLVQKNFNLSIVMLVAAEKITLVLNLGELTSFVTNVCQVLITKCGETTRFVSKMN